MIDAIQHFTSILSFIPIALGVVGASVVVLTYISSWFQVTRRPTMWRNY